MTEQTNIERVVMRRVHTIHTLRPFVSLGTISAVVLMFALWGIGREVWVARVFENMPRSGDLPSVVRFYFSAFNNTRVVVQALTIITLMSLIHLVRTFSRLVVRSVGLAIT